MNIVLDEHRWAEQMIYDKSLGKKPFETLSRVAKYYIDKDYDKSHTRSMLDIFLLQCDPTASLTKWSDTLDNAVNRALKYEAILIDSINITEAEMSILESISSKQSQRLAFTLLCLAKYWDIVNPNGDHWVNNKDNEIMAMANINTSIKRQSLMYHNLKECGLIQFSKKIDNTNVRVLFMNNNSPVAMRIADFRNLGYQYLLYHGEPYFQCESCGLTIKKQEPFRGRPQKYCRDCAIAIKTRQSVNAVMKRRTASQNCRISNNINIPLS